MIASLLASQSACCHVLDVATRLEHESVDLLRQAANATSAGDDWFLTTAPPSATTLWRSTPTLVSVEAPILDGPHEAHCTLRWQTLHTALPRHGRLILRALATSTGHRPITELTLLEVANGRNAPRRADHSRPRDAAYDFLRELARRLEREQSMERAS